MALAASGSTSESLQGSLFEWLGSGYYEKVMTGSPIWKTQVHRIGGSAGLLWAHRLMASSLQTVPFYFNDMYTIRIDRPTLSTNPNQNYQAIFLGCLVHENRIRWRQRSATKLLHTIIARYGSCRYYHHYGILPLPNLAPERTNSSPMSNCPNLV